MPAGSLLWRIYSAAGAFPAAWNGFRTWGPHARMRFDHHLPGSDGRPVHQERAVLYGAFSIETCLAEYFQTTREIDPIHPDRPTLTQFVIRRPLHLLNLHGDWVTRAGASLAMSTGPRDRTRRWSRVLHEMYPAMDGLYYGSSMNAGGCSFVLNERARDALPTDPLLNLGLEDIRLLPVLMNAGAKLGYALR